MAWSVYLLVMLVGLIRGQYYDDYDDYTDYADYADNDYGNNNGLEDIYAGMEATILTKEVRADGKRRQNVNLQCQYESPGKYGSFLQNSVWKLWSTATFPIIWSKIDEANTVIAVDTIVVGQDYKGRGIKLYLKKDISKYMTNQGK